MKRAFPLTKANRIRLARAYRDVPRVDLSLDCVVEGQMGKAFVDDLQDPRVFKVEVGPFFYLAGEACGRPARLMLGNLTPGTLLMPSAAGWLDAAQAMYGERLMPFPRYSFSFATVTDENLSGICATSPFAGAVKSMDHAFANRVWDKDHFVDLSDFDSPRDFVQRGVGFYLETAGEIIGAAYSSLVCSRGIEVSVFVLDEYRRRGIATVLAACLLRWCLAHDMEGHYDAANPISCILAERLGYTRRGGYLAYYLQTG